ncbi:coiled-coil domain-containing protein 97 isoform X2 [Solenopsis invicta]|uniref:coiled-coil domain-containing protein 97 isoform X2 n=1 Tax=Solenopsis invicta TaxID=13686 RepID=UPI00193D7402|nr:coiled-coil domain-containing protein 97 isoform X2 [Solenopsis invicta]
MNKVKESSTRQENMTLRANKDTLVDENKNSNSEQTMDFFISDMVTSSLENELLDYVANSKAIFKSQQKEEPELTFEEKHAIAENLLKKSCCLFLSKFGHYLKMEHLEYFSKSQDYETVYHVNRLRRYLNNSTRHIDVRNRRYEALRTLIEKGDYFSECEMMKRNPLLYEHLVGQYLTEEEKKARDSIDTQSANYVDILMETIERSKLENYLKSQRKEENEIRDKNDLDDDDNDDSKNSIISKNLDKRSYQQWGENLKDNDEVKDKDRDKKLQSSKISNEEIKLLRQEFVTNMYQSFLDVPWMIMKLMIM